VKWAISKFKPYKSDNVVQVLLQKSLKTLPTLVLLIGYLSKVWRGVKVVYKPKAGNKDPEQTKKPSPLNRWRG
jgi:hypothetical protein